MKHSNNNLRMALLALLLPLTFCAMAQTRFWAGGIQYQINSNYDSNYNTVKVISASGGSYSGFITIPSIASVVVTNNYGESYTKHYVVTEVGENAFRDCTGLTGIVLPNSITKISKNAFYGCSGLTNVTIPSGVNTIGMSAFGNCTGLTSIILPNSVMTMDANTFYGCTSLASVTLSKSLTSLVGTFQGCTALTTVDIPANVKTLDGTFHGCNSLCNVTLPKSIHVIGANTFDGCTALTQISLPNTLEQIGDRAFAESGLRYLTLPVSVQSLGQDALYGCESLESIIVRAIEPPAMVNRESFSDRTYLSGTILFPEISCDAYLNTDWWNNFVNHTEIPGLENPYDFEVDGIYYLITGAGTVDVTYRSKDYNTYSGTVNIPATVTKYNTTYTVRAIGNSAFRDCPGLTGVNISGSVSVIGSHAFDGCTGLAHIDIPESVVEIGDSAFLACTGLTDLTIPVNVAAIGTDAFAGIPVQSLTWNARECWTNGGIATEGIANLNIGNAVTVLPERLAYHSQITAVTLPLSLTTIGKDAFLDCEGLSSLTVPENVSRIDANALSGTSIASLTWNARECWSNGCTADSASPYMPVTEVTIGDGVMVLPNGFVIRSGITSLTIPASVKFIGNQAFKCCRGLAEVVIPDAVITVGNEAFVGCNQVINVSIGKSVSSLGDDAFGGIFNMKTLTWNARWCESLGSMNYISTLEQVNLGNEVELIPEELGCGSSVTSVEIPASVTTIGRRAFADTHLSSLFIPRSVTAIGENAFNMCNPYLESIVVENGNPVYDSRRNCNALLLTARDSLLLTCMNTVIPEEVTDIPAEAFWGVDGLKNIVIPQGVTTIGLDAFYGCKGLTSIVIPAGVKLIGTGAFANCSGLESIQVDPGNTVYDSRGNCQAIIETATNTLLTGCKNTTIPKTVKIIANAAFRNCTDLTDIVIPDSVTTIKFNAFEYCSQLKNVTIGRSVTDIQSSAFGGCRNLETVTSLATTPPQLSWSAFLYYVYGYQYHTNAKLRVPEAAIEAYRAHQYWSRFDPIEGITGSGPGDMNGNGNLDINDVTSLIDLILSSDEALQDNPYADVNGDGKVDIRDVTDLIYMILNTE